MNNLALAYDPVPGRHAERISIQALGSHDVPAACKDELLAALRDLKPRKGARLVVLDADVGELAESQRHALRARLAFLPPEGGLLSSLNAWENISLPVAYHEPARLGRAPAQVQSMVAGIGGVEADWLAKLPENMTLYEKRLAAFLRAVLEAPQLLVTGDLGEGLGPTKRERTAQFAQVYLANCPGGTFVQLLKDDAGLNDG